METTAMRSLKLLFAALAVIVFARPSEAASFRDCDWGDSESKIRATESANFLAESLFGVGSKDFIFNDRVAGLDAFVIYLLDHDRLAQAKYFFPQEYIESNLYLEDFARVERILREENGQPAESGEIWRDGALKGREDPGRMIAVGELTLRSRWANDDTEILHVLKGDSLDIDHEVVYVSKRFGHTGTGLMDTIRPRTF
jgi:hypothetical protein